MPIPQESSNVELDDGKLQDDALGKIKRDIGALCRDANRPHNDLSGRSDDFTHPLEAITGLVAALATKYDKTGGAISGAVTIAGVLTTQSALIVKVTSVATAGGTTAVSATDQHVDFTGTQSQTCMLVACATGRKLTISNSSTGIITINRSGSDTIDRLYTVIYLMPNDSVDLCGYGTNWKIT